MKLICGLGNPGNEYRTTKHNAGFLAIDAFIDKNLPNEHTNYSKKFNAEILDTRFDSVRTLFVKPQTFMNVSGKSIKDIAAYFKVDPINILVIYDDKDIQFGDVRTSGSSAGGHNGVSSIITALETKDFSRCRIGIKTEMLQRMETKDFVLSQFSKNELTELEDHVFPTVHTIIERFIQNS